MNSEASLPAASLTVCGVLLASVSAWAQLVINNPSFEDPVLAPGTYVNAMPDWTVTGLVGVADPAGIWTGIWGPVPDGKQFGYVINGSVEQTLSDALLPNTAYTLSIDVGTTTDGSQSPGTSYSVSLFAGANLLTAVVPVAPPAGAWTTLTATYTTGASVLPGNLTIQMAYARLDISTPDTFHFDNVRLDAMPVPEPGRAVLVAGFGLLAFAGVRRFRR